ncbi:Sec63 Brl domain-containing protein [Amylostereum chailletii]|nr:Sec63 Brl domain-containing protein [Amylostereum chailletii]
MYAFLFRWWAHVDNEMMVAISSGKLLGLGKLLERVPIPVKEGVEDKTAKINVFLQAYISQLKLEGFTLVADMVFVQQSAGRETLLKRAWAVPARTALDMSKMVEKRISEELPPKSLARPRENNSYVNAMILILRPDPPPDLLQASCPPEEFPPPTPLLDLHPLPLSALHSKEFESICAQSLQTVNNIQTQVFQALYTSDENDFIDALTGSMRRWDVLSRCWRQRKNIQNIGLLIADEVQLVGGEVGPTYEVIISRTRYVSAGTDIKTRIVACGVSLANVRDLGEWMGAPSHAIFNFPPRLVLYLSAFGICFLLHCSADDNEDKFLNIELKDLQPHLDHVSDRALVETLMHRISGTSSRDIGVNGRTYKTSALTADEVQLVGGEVGPTYEVIISRTRYVSARTDIKTRIVACGVSLANARDLGEWMGAPSHAIFNFPPRLVLYLSAFSICFLLHCSADDNEDKFLNIELKDLQPHLDHVSDRALVETLMHRIGFHHEALSEQEKRVVGPLFQSGAIQVIIAWKLVGDEVGPSYEVIISRARYVLAQMDIKTLIVACGVLLAKPARPWRADGRPVFNLPPRLVLYLSAFQSTRNGPTCRQRQRQRPCRPFSRHPRRRRRHLLISASSARPLDQDIHLRGFTTLIFVPRLFTAIMHIVSYHRTWGQFTKTLIGICPLRRPAIRGNHTGSSHRHPSGFGNSATVLVTTTGKYSSWRTSIIISQ